ncbi:MAG: DUF3187 family protein, partial [Acidobacteria bacterium]|nr:DUF3187 family protein [Acidobacteriota bacterium]
AILITAATNASMSQDFPPHRPLSMPDPIRAASLPFDLSFPAPTADGRWNVTAGLAWFNTWSTVWELTQVHQDFGFDNTTTPIPAEFRTLEDQYPSEQFHFIDIEGNLLELSATRGLPGGWSIGVRVPWMTIGRPKWDGFIDQWHSWFGLTNSNRNFFPRSENLLYIRGRDGVIEEVELGGSGLGDISVSLATPGLELIGGRHRAVVALEAPTGKTGTLRGSGGWDLGLRLKSTWTWRRSRLQAAAGFNVLDDHGDLLGIPRADTWFAGTSYEFRLGRRWTATAAASFESSPLADFTDGEAGEPALFRVLALALDLGPGWLAEMQYGTNKDGMGIAPDTAFRLVVVFTP